MPRILCLLAEGFEEIEAIVPIDLLRRAECKVEITALTEDRAIKGRNGITIIADNSLSKISAFDAKEKPTFDALMIPGGPGVSKLREDGRAGQLAAAYAAAGVWVAAICAAPVILSDAGLLASRRFTAHFSVQGELSKALLEERVVIDGNIITSRGAGTALDFGLTLVHVLTNTQKMEEVASSIMYK